MEYVHAFWVGGLICAAVQILMDRTTFGNIDKEIAGY